MNIKIFGKALSSILLVLCLTITPVAVASNVTFAWDPISDPQVAGYKVVYGFSSRNYQYNVDAGNSTSLVISGLQSGTTYYFAAVVYSTDGQQSDYSDEIIYTPATASDSQQSAHSDKVIYTPATAPAPTCSFVIWPTSQSFSASGGTGTVIVSTMAGCSWTVSASASWMTLASRISGIGPGIVRYTVSSAMAGVSRAATITVAGKTFIVNQTARYRINKRNPQEDLNANKLIVPPHLSR